MIHIGGPLPSKMRRYEEELAEWKAICDEMTAAEKRAVARFRPDKCELCQYWAQQCVGCCVEIPSRLCYHTTCMVGSYVCCTTCCDEKRSVWRHHATVVQEYWWITKLLMENLCAHPCTPWYVYHAEVGLARPPKPEPPKGCCDDMCCPPRPQKECDCDCSCERIVSHVNRHLRSLLCTFSGMHACHPSHCLGPCPCIAWHSQAQTPKDSDDASKEDVGSETDESPPVLGQQASYKMWLRTQEANFSAPANHAGSGSRCCLLPGPCCVIETTFDRHLRWAAEYDAARRERTDAFYRRRNAKAAVPSGEPITAADSLSTDYVKFGEPLEEEEVLDGDTHLCERVQGRAAALALLSCCCAGAIAGVHGIAAVAAA